MISWGLLIDCISGFGFFVDGQVPYPTLEMQFKLFHRLEILMVKLILCKPVLVIIQFMGNIIMQPENIIYVCTLNILKILKLSLKSKDLILFECIMYDIFIKTVISILLALEFKNSLY